MSLPRICPSCQCIFHQDFVCTTCGAEKLRDETVRVQQEQIEALQAEVEILRDSPCAHYNRVQDLEKDVEALQAAGRANGLANKRLGRGIFSEEYRSARYRCEACVIDGSASVIGMHQKRTLHQGRVKIEILRQIGEKS